MTIHVAIIGSMTCHWCHKPIGNTAICYLILDRATYEAIALCDICHGSSQGELVATVELLKKGRT